MSSLREHKRARRHTDEHHREETEYITVGFCLVDKDLNWKYYSWTLCNLPRSDSDDEPDSENYDHEYLWHAVHKLKNRNPMCTLKMDSTGRIVYDKHASDLFFWLKRTLWRRDVDLNRGHPAFHPTVDLLQQFAVSVERMLTADVAVLILEENDAVKTTEDDEDHESRSSSSEHSA